MSISAVTTVAGPISGCTITRSGHGGWRLTLTTATGAVTAHLPSGDPAVLATVANGLMRAVGVLCAEIDELADAAAVAVTGGTDTRPDGQPAA